MKPKIFSLEILSKLLSKERAKRKKIIHCHGLFFSDQKATFRQKKNQIITENRSSKIFFDKLKLPNSKQPSV